MHIITGWHLPLCEFISNPIKGCLVNRLAIFRGILFRLRLNSPRSGQEYFRLRLNIYQNETDFISYRDTNSMVFINKLTSRTYLHVSLLTNRWPAIGRRFKVGPVNDSSLAFPKFVFTVNLLAVKNQYLASVISYRFLVSCSATKRL